MGQDELTINVVESVTLPVQGYVQKRAPAVLFETGAARAAGSTIKIANSKSIILKEG